jgi:hypothetical protein
MKRASGSGSLSSVGVASASARTAQCRRGSERGGIMARYSQWQAAAAVRGEQRLRAFSLIC